MSFPLPPVAELTPEQREAYDMFPANLSRGLVLTKSSAKPYLALGVSFRDGWLPPQLRELVILRVGAATSTDYEIYHHRHEAGVAGLSDQLIDAVLSGDVSLGDDRLDALVAYVDALLARVAGAGVDTASIREHFSDGEVAEITLLTGHYVMTAIFIKTLGIEPEGGAGPGGILEQANAKFRQ